jgi:hypothetical protein
MAAKNKRANRAETSDAAAQNPYVRTDSSTYLRASQHRDELLQEARALMAAGKVREARAVEKRASQVLQLLGALESDVPAASRPQPH